MRRIAYAAMRGYEAALDQRSEPRPSDRFPIRRLVQIDRLEAAL